MLVLEMRSANTIYFELELNMQSFNCKWRKATSVAKR